MNKLKGWKTLGLSLVVAVIGTMEAFQWTDIVNESVAAWLLPILGIVFGYLRTITNTAAGKAE